MGTYTPNRLNIPLGLDEIGLRLGLYRLDGESVGDYRRRLLLEARDPGGPSERDYIRTVNRKVGEFDVPVFSIDLVLDVNDDPVAVDPYIEITSTHLRAYDDKENDSIDVEISLVDRGDAYFLNDIVAAFAGNTYFALTTLAGYDQYLRSDRLKFSTTENVVKTETLSQSREHRLANDRVRNIYPTALVVFQNEVVTPDLVVAEGDYWVDYHEGIIITYEPMYGYITYSYQEFPFTVYWQTVRVWPYNDTDKRYLLYDTQIDDDTGLPVNTLLNSSGAELADTVLAVHPLGWGK